MPTSARSALRMVALAAAVLSVGAGCSEARGGIDNPAAVRFPVKLHPATSGLPAAHAGTPLTINAGTILCLDRDGRAELTGLHAIRPSSNFKVANYAVRPNVTTPGAEHLGEIVGSLHDAGFDETDHTVTTTCGHHGEGSELAVEIVRSGPGPAISHGFAVQWASEGEAGTLRIPMTVVLCDGPTARPRRCDAQKLD